MYRIGAVTKTGYKNGDKNIYTLRERETKREGYRQGDAGYKN